MWHLPNEKIFFNNKYDIYQNILDLNFLARYYLDISECLNKLFEVKKHIVCHLILNEYKYSHIDWYNGEKYLILLSQAFNFYEKKKT